MLKKDEKKGFENQSNPKEEIWKCNGCLMSNKCDALKCPACGTLKKPGVIKEGIKAEGHPQKKDGENGFGDLLKNKEGGWKCDECLCSNNSDVLKCPVCGIVKPCDKKEDLPKETGKSSAFGSSTAGFNFGGKRGFTFGTTGKSDTKASSAFTFPRPDLAKEKSESNPASICFTFTSTKSDAEKNKPDFSAKGFNFTLQPYVTTEKSSEPQRPIYGTSPAAQNVGTVCSSSSTPTTLPLLGSLLAASTSPDKPLGNPVSMVTSIAPGSSAPKGTFSFGQQQSYTTGTRSTSSFGQVSSTTQGAVQNLLTSATKAYTTTPGTDGNIFQFPQKENIIACKLPKETSLVNSPLKTSDGCMHQEYELNVYIKPVIDLPDLVETKTGEEEEETIFCEEATLLRFDEGLWKERGSGELKLLRYKQTKRVNLLMRRDQVLKDCAKHFLTNKMKLYPLQSSKMALSWIAEGEIKIQYFVVCFKDEDLALKFKATFEKLQSELQQVKPNQVLKEPAKSVIKNKPSLGSKLKKENGVGTCTVCLVSRKSDVQKCAVCQTMKPGLKQEDIKQKESKSFITFGSTSGGFKFENTTSDQQFPCFSSQLDASPKSAADIKFGQTTKIDSTTSATGSGFKIGGQTVPIVKPSSDEADTGKLSLNGAFKFGQLPGSDKTKATSEAVSFGPTVASTYDKKTEFSKPDQSITESSKSALIGFTFQESTKPYCFSFGGDTKSNTSKPASVFTFDGFNITTTKSVSEKNKPDAAAKGSNFTFQPCLTPEKSSEIQTRPFVQDKPSLPQPDVVQEITLGIKPDTRPRRLQYTNDDVKILAKGLFWEVIGDMAKEVSVDLVQGAMMISNGTVVPQLERSREVVTEENKKVKEGEDEVEYTTEEDEEDDDTYSSDEDEGTLVGPGLGHLIRSMRTAIDDDSVMY